MTNPENGSEQEETFDVTGQMAARVELLNKIRIESEAEGQRQARELKAKDMISEDQKEESEVLAVGLAKGRARENEVTSTTVVPEGQPEASVEITEEVAQTNEKQEAKESDEDKKLRYIHTFIEENKDSLGLDKIYEAFERQGYPRNMVVDSNIHYYLDENHEQFDYQLLYQELYKAKYTRDEIVDANITHYLKENLDKYPFEALEKALLEVDPPYTQEEIDRNKGARVYKPLTQEVAQETEQSAPAPVDADEQIEDTDTETVKPKEATTAPEAKKEVLPANFKFLSSFRLRTPLEKMSLQDIEAKLVPQLQKELKRISGMPEARRAKTKNKLEDVETDLTHLKEYIELRKISDSL